MRPCVLMMLLAVGLNQVSVSAEEAPFRPEPGKFPPIEKAHSYRGELVFVDHVNRRGSIRVEGEGTYFRNVPHPFAMLPYGIVRYHGAPADLRDIPLGTVLHVRGFLPPSPETSVVPVLSTDSKNRTHGYSGKGITPAENHLLLLEDEMSYCLSNGKVWRLKEVTLSNRAGTIVATRESKTGESAEVKEETLTIDAATRIWRGRERLSIDDLITDEIWPAEGKKTLDGQPVQLGIVWKPSLKDIFKQFHIADIWLDDTAVQRATQNQTETHKVSIRSRWMPGWVDHVEYGKFGEATITATLFGGMDESLYADFKKGEQAMMNPVEQTLKHTHGSYGPGHMACKGPILEVTQSAGEIPVGSSGVQIKFKTDLIIEGIRPGRTVRVSLRKWPQTNVPREEYLRDGAGSIENRFPSPDIFPKY
ncbi:MAG: hypothetical protein AAF226_01670 [Verrucomicrobiota bacterium]